MGTKGSFPGPKKQKCEVDHSPSINANFMAFTLLWTTAELAATSTVYNNFCSSNFLSGTISHWISHQFFSFHGSMDFNKLFSGRQLHQGGKVVDAAVCPTTLY